MMPAAKHGDPQIGVDIHLCVVPPSPSPVPLPTPHTSIVFDPMDYIPVIGATVTVCGMKRAIAGTNGKAIHIPPGFPFAPKIPDTSDEIFMGSATVVADGDPFSFLGVPVLSCQVAGMLSPPRLKKKEKKLMLLPTVTNLAIPTNVFIGGPPTISLMGMASKLGFAALGKFAKSGLFKRMRQKAFGWMKPGFLKCKVLRAEPVDITTGEVSIEQLDFTLPGRMPIEWVRTYRSNNVRRGACGYGWETPADIRLEVMPQDNSVAFLRPAAAPALFPEMPAAGGENGAVLELWDGALLIDHGSEFRVRTKEDRIYHFRKLEAFIRKDGVREYPVNRISDLCENWLEFKRHGPDVTTIEESAGRRIEIETEGGLIRQLQLSVPSAEFRHVFVRYKYDRTDNLVTVLDAFDNPYTFAYENHHLVRHTDRNGLSFYYEFDIDGEAWQVIHSWGDGGLYNYRFEYLDELNERRITDSLGNVSLVKLDERGLPISEIDPIGGLTIFEYDEVGRTCAIVDQSQRRTEYKYDDQGNLLALTRPDGAAIFRVFDANNKVLATTGPNGAQIRQCWDERGLLTQQCSPLGNISRYEYDSAGQLVAFSNPRGARTQLTFDSFGNLTVLRDALGYCALFRYDALGNLTAKTDALGRETTYRYDLKRRVTEICLPSGAIARCTYDAEDNLLRYEDEAGGITQLEYFGQGQIARRVLADGQSIKYTYDADENLTGVYNQRGELYQIKRDALGRIVEEVDYWGHQRCYAYDAGGHLVANVDSLGRRIEYKTDTLGRVIKKLLPEGLVEEFAYDADGNLVACENRQIRIERSFDAEGRMLEENQGGDFIIRHTYDEVGNCIQRQTTLMKGDVDLGHTVKYTHDLLDQTIGIAIDDHSPIGMELDAAGQITLEKLSPMLRRQTEYSADGYCTRHLVLADANVVLNVAYSYDATGNLVERRDAGAGSDIFTYDPLGRIKKHLDPQGNLEYYFSDPAGDRLHTYTIEGRPTIVERETRMATRIWSREADYNGAVYRFDCTGTLVERTGLDGGTQFIWDANQRLVESRTAGVSTTYSYDAIGRRLFKRRAGVCTRFYWDDDMLVAEETVPEATDRSPEKIDTIVPDTREYIYRPETFEPMAFVCRKASSSAIVYFHNEPNGCPSKLFDSRGDVVWAARLGAMGKIEVLPGNKVTNSLRLQGQYYDFETDLHYNRHRYFDPLSGSFVSQDPLGLIAGVNLYRFAPNVLGWIDPLGLAKCLPRDLSKGPHAANTPIGSVIDRAMHGAKAGPQGRWLSSQAATNAAAAAQRKGSVAIKEGEGVIVRALPGGGIILEKAERAAVIPQANGFIHTFPIGPEHPLFGIKGD